MAPNGRSSWISIVSEGGGVLTAFSAATFVTGGGIAYRTSENLAPATTKKNFKFSVTVFAKCEQWAIKWVRLSEAAKNLFLSGNTPVMPPLNEVS
jgi:hypothetical protein